MKPIAPQMPPSRRSLPHGGRIVAAALSVLICLALLHATAGPAAGGEDERVYIEVPAASQIRQFRFFAPPKVWRDEAVFRVDAPRRAAELIDSGALLCRIRLRGEDDRRAEAAVAFDSPAPGRGRGGGDQPSPRQGEAGIDLADWPDGTVTAELIIEPAAGNNDAEAGADDLTDFAAPSAQQLRIVRDAVAAIAEPYRDEMRTWLDDHNRSSPIWGKVPQWPNLRHALANPEAPFDGLRGFMLRSYHNPQLHRRQPYTLYVPESIDTDEPMPLLILLHGSGGDYRNLIADYAAGQRFEEHPMLIANAGAYFNQEFRHLALNDIRWVIEDVKAKYAVDADRVYLQGISLGGRGSLEAAALLPDTFAAICPQGIYGVVGEFIDPAIIQADDVVAARLAARTDIRTVLPNLRNIATEVIFGWDDTVTPPFHALAVDMALRRISATVRSRGFDAGHNITVPAYDWADTRKWMLEHPRDRNPREVALRVVNLRHNRADWVEVHALDDYSGIGDITARFDEESSTLTVQMSNIAAVTLDPPFDCRRLVINDAPPIPAPDGPITLRMDEQGDIQPGRWEPAADDERWVKRPGRSGPMWDVWAEPVIYAFDAGDEAAARRLEVSARLSSRWDMSFGDRHLPVSAFQHLDEAELSRNSIVLFAAPERLSALLDAEDLAFPLRAAAPPTPGAQQQENSPQRQTPPQRTPATWERAELRIALLPSPWSSDHYLLVVETTAMRPFSLHELGWWDNGLHADWLIATVAGDATPTAARRARPRGGMQLLGAGVYDHHWHPAAHTRGDYRPNLSALLHIHRNR